MGFLFFDKAPGWVSVTEPKMCIPEQVIFKVFAQICCYLSKFQNTYSQKNCIFWVEH